MLSTKKIFTNHTLRTLAFGKAKCKQTKFELVWSLESVVVIRGSENQFPAEGALRGPRLSSPVERERSAAKDRGTGGQYVAVFVQSPTHLSHITLSQPFRIKCERYIFLKNCVSFVIIVLTMFPHVYVYMYYAYSWLWLCDNLVVVFFRGSAAPHPTNLWRKPIQYIFISVHRRLFIVDENSVREFELQSH